MKYFEKWGGAMMTIVTAAYLIWMKISDKRTEEIKKQCSSWCYMEQQFWNRHFVKPLTHEFHDHNIYINKIKPPSHSKHTNSTSQNVRLLWMHSNIISLHVLRITQKKKTMLCGPNHWFKTPTIRLRCWHLMAFLIQLSFNLYSTCILQ